MQQIDPFESIQNLKSEIEKSRPITQINIQDFISPIKQTENIKANQKKR